MRMQEPEQWPSSEAPGIMGQEYGPYRAETRQNALGQKIFPQESRVSVLSVLIIVLSAIGICSAIVGIVSAVYILYSGANEYQLAANFLGLVGSVVALLLFVTILVLSVIAAVRRAARFRQSRFR